MVTAVVAITLAGILWALLAAVLVYLCFLVLVRLGVPVPIEVAGLIAVIVFLAVLFGGG